MSDACPCGDVTCRLEPCDGCTDWHGSIETPDGRFCRDCDIQHGLDSMECSACKRMRYVVEKPLGDFGAYLWGEPCTCDPKPLSTWEVEHAKEAP